MSGNSVTGYVSFSVLDGVGVRVKWLEVASHRNEKHWSANLAHALPQVLNCYLVALGTLVVLNATKYVIMTDVTARLNLEEFHQYNFRSISAGGAWRHNFITSCCSSKIQHPPAYNFHGHNVPSLPWSLYSEPRCIQPLVHVTV